MIVPNSRLAGLIERWHRSRQQKQDVTPEELCRDCPELFPKLQEAIAACLRDRATRPPSSGSDPELLPPSSPVSLGERANGELIQGSHGSDHPGTLSGLPAQHSPPLL